MGMFSKLVAFLDKAAGVPAWIIYAENIRKLDVERGCPTLAKAIIDNEALWPLASYSLEEMVPKLAGMVTIARIAAEADPSIVGSKRLVHEVIAAYEGPIGEDLQVLYDFVGKDIPSVEVVEIEKEAVPAPVDTSTAEVVEIEKEAATTSEDTITEEVVEVEEEAVPAPEDTSTAEIVEVKEEAATTSEDTITEEIVEVKEEAVPAPVLDPHVRAQLIHGMTKVISRGRKVAPTLKVLNTMSGGDRSAIIEALTMMEAKGNSIAKAILEDPSL